LPGYGKLLKEDILNTTIGDVLNLSIAVSRTGGKVVKVSLLLSGHWEDPEG
jgi:hypothetical protein